MKKNQESKGWKLKRKEYDLVATEQNFSSTQSMAGKTSKPGLGFSSSVWNIKRK